MTVPVQIPFNQYIANGATTEFPFTFLATNETHLKVFLGDTQQTTGFTVTGVGDDAGGSVMAGSLGVGVVALPCDGGRVRASQWWCGV